jgi:hypothetical protein
LVRKKSTLGGAEAYLIHTTELDIDIQVFFVQSLKERVEQSRKRWRLGLLDDFGTRLPRVVF